MAPSRATEDYYHILEVDQSATIDMIVQSYRRLALKLHPDRNSHHSATNDFQRLAQAYETLKDEFKRREYNRIYATLRKTSFSTRPPEARTGAQRSQPDSGENSPSSRNPPRAPQQPAQPAQPPESKPLSEKEQIALVGKVKVERKARWEKNKTVMQSRLAEKAAKAWENEWVCNILSPFYRKMLADTEEERSRKEREKQERIIEENLKGRRLEQEGKKLEARRAEFEAAQSVVLAADLANDGEIEQLRYIMDARLEQAQRERERIEKEAAEQHHREVAAKRERDRKDKDWRDREEAAERERERHVSETTRRQRAAQRQMEADEHARRERLRAEEHQRQLDRLADEVAARQQTCRHDCWWDKVQGRTAWPSCDDVWAYLLQSPSCDMVACPKCQSEVRRH